jgi:hypothetical protein
MIAYAKLIKDCKRWKKIDYDRYTILEWRLKRRWVRELKRRGLK